MCYLFVFTALWHEHTELHPVPQENPPIMLCTSTETAVGRPPPFTISPLPTNTQCLLSPALYSAPILPRLLNKQTSLCDSAWRFFKGEKIEEWVVMIALLPHLTQDVIKQYVVINGIAFPLVRSVPAVEDLLISYAHSGPNPINNGNTHW